MSFQKLMEHFILKYLVVPKTPAVEPGKKHVACIGDSITFGAGVNGKREETWEYFLNGLLGEEFQVLNYGISGRTLQKEGDYPYTADKFYPVSKYCGAETYLIMLGTNDAKPYNWDRDRYEKQLAAFAKEYMDLSQKPEVILMTPPQCYVDPKIGKVGFDIEAETIDGQITDIVKKTAADLGLRVIDLHALTQDHSAWFDDGVHPNREGNEEIAKYIAAELGKA